ncbi:MAG: hypothetical protein SWK90_07500 [Chloroflexota bacterium]|nr:hypothetical protein [Chloroflexota bacterium]
MKKLFLLLVVLLLPLISGCQSVQPVSAQSPLEIADLHREVQLLNLINGLELSPEQMRLIVGKAQEVQELHEELETEADEEEMTSVLEEFRATLMAGENIPPDLVEQWHIVQGQFHTARDAYEVELTRIAGEVEAGLEEHQLYALEQYVPCVVPPQGELRVGQARGTGGSEALLERLRALPAERFERHGKEIARRILERIREHTHGAVVILDEEIELERIVGLLEDARALPDVEFELQKENLAEELLAPYEMARPQRDPTAVISRHLLDPSIIPLLEEKLALSGE